MDSGFWLARWEANQIAFHEAEGNALLAEALPRFGLAEGARVFLPLCGKTRDIAALLARGFRVAGAELSARAVDQLFEELGVEPETAAAGPLRYCRAPGLDVFVGDVFEVTAARLGAVDLVYDRAALVALPAEMRGPYAAHLAAIADRAPQLLIAFEYDQSRMEGPPFAVDAAEVARVHGAAYRPEELLRRPVPGGLKALSEVEEVAWRLHPRA